MNRPVVVDVAATFERLGLTVVERGWLSSNCVVFRASADAPATVVDSGYVSHAPQTAELIGHALAGEPLGRVVNTHLHSDHCGGNAELQRRWQCETWVPAPSFEAVRRWDSAALAFEAVGQRCEPFRAERPVAAGETLWLGPMRWKAYATPGHDPHALIYFEPQSRVLLAGDSLWQDGLAVVFPELEGDEGFDGVARSLDLIESLAPAVVVPGHGAAFTDVSAAIGRARSRLEAFRRDPRRHGEYALRVLAMFHMLESRRRTRDALIAWMQATPLMQRVLHTYGGSAGGETLAELVIERLLAGGQLAADGDWLEVSGRT